MSSTSPLTHGIHQQMTNYRTLQTSVPIADFTNTYNMVHACEIANKAEKSTAIQRASGFNELYKAAVKKECDNRNQSGKMNRTQEMKGKGKGKAV